MRFPSLLCRPTLSAAHVQRFWRCDSGVNAIEFAFVVPFVVALLLITVQVAVIFIAQAYLETVSEAAMRLVLTNQANSISQATFKTDVCNEATALFTCNGLIVELQQAPSSASAIPSALPQFDTNGNLIGTPGFSLAPAPAKMMLVVMYQWPVIGGPLGFNLGNMGNGTKLLVSTQVFQIEPTS